MRSNTVASNIQLLSYATHVSNYRNINGVNGAYNNTGVQHHFATIIYNTRDAIWMKSNGIEYKYIEWLSYGHHDYAGISSLLSYGWLNFTYWHNATIIYTRDAMSMSNKIVITCHETYMSFSSNEMFRGGINTINAGRWTIYGLYNDTATCLHS